MSRPKDVDQTQLIKGAQTLRRKIDINKNPISLYPNKAINLLMQV